MISVKTVHYQTHGGDPEQPLTQRSRLLGERAERQCRAANLGSYRETSPATTSVHPRRPSTTARAATPNRPNNGHCPLARVAPQSSRR